VFCFGLIRNLIYLQISTGKSIEMLLPAGERQTIEKGFD
jgi:hypothetical protein